MVVAPTWMNGGTSATFTLNGAASAFDGPAGATYTLNDSAAAYGTLGHLASVQCTDCYEMSIDNPAVRPAAHWDASFTETPAMSAPTAGPPPKTWTLHVGASFADVPTSDLFYKFIETIFHNGVTGGCGAPGYCPANPALRKQMAVFLLKSRYGSAYAPPPAVGIFADVPQADAFAPWIEDLYNRGITGGCSASPLNYCPDNTVLAPADGRLPPEDAGGLELRAAGLHGRVRGRAVSLDVRSVDRGSRGARDHGRLRRRQLLSDGAEHARADGGVPDEDVRAPAVRSVAVHSVDRGILPPLPPLAGGEGAG